MKRKNQIDINKCILIINHCLRILIFLLLLSDSPSKLVKSSSFKSSGILSFSSDSINASRSSVNYYFLKPFKMNHTCISLFKYSFIFIFISRKEPSSNLIPLGVPKQKFLLIMFYTYHLQVHGNVHILILQHLQATLFSSFPPRKESKNIDLLNGHEFVCQLTQLLYIIN